MDAADVTTQYKYKNAVFDVKIDTDSSVSVFSVIKHYLLRVIWYQINLRSFFSHLIWQILTTVTFTEILPSTKAIVSFKVPDNSSGKVFKKIIK